MSEQSNEQKVYTGKSKKASNPLFIVVICAVVETEQAVAPVFKN